MLAFGDEWPLGAGRTGQQLGAEGVNTADLTYFRAKRTCSSTESAPRDFFDEQCGVCDQSGQVHHPGVVDSAGVPWRNEHVECE